VRAAPRCKLAQLNGATESGPGQLSVIVAVPVVRVVQVPADEVVDVIAMRYGFVATAGPVPVVHVMRSADVLGCALIRVGAVDCDRALDDLGTLHLVQMPVVEIVDMATMSDGHVATIRSVQMRVLLVNRLLSHIGPPGHSGFKAPRHRNTRGAALMKRRPGAA